MSNLSACCIMLANGRPEMVKRAIRSFKAQTYPEFQKHLLIFDTGAVPLYDLARGSIIDPSDITVSYTHMALDANAGAPVGTLRNMANDLALKAWDVLLHWDSDDWSHPRRIEEQVALLEQTKADAVGYNDMLFWESVQLTEDNVYGSGSSAPCDVIERAWLYRHRNPNYCLGTSLCYWRKTWEQVPFLPLPVGPGGTGEEFNWLKKVRAAGASCFPNWTQTPEKTLQPRMIASIHGSNTQYYGDDMLTTYAEWSLAPEWDAHCRKVMEL